MKFYKYTGLGNDFIIVVEPDSMNRNEVEHYCSRRFGIGADGVVALRQIGTGEFEMRIFNSDGSEAMMCGNATRCAALLLEKLGRVNGNTFALHTRSGIVRPTLLENGFVRVDMGAPRTFLGRVNLYCDGGAFTAETVSMGNPHAVIFVEDMEAIQLEKWGAALEIDPLFPDKCNIEFAQVINPERIRMRVWERGCGVTPACGTGSCATYTAARRSGRCGESVEIVLDGGSLFISDDPETGNILMTGPATELYTGVWQ